MSHTARYRARKQHRCHWCGEQITSCEVYVRDFSYHDGRPQVLKMHSECWDALNEASREYGPDFEFYDYENTRGCFCGGDHGCERCAARRKEEAQEAAA